MLSSYPCLTTLFPIGRKLLTLHERNAKPGKLTQSTIRDNTYKKCIYNEIIFIDNKIHLANLRVQICCPQTSGDIDVISYVHTMIVRRDLGSIWSGTSISHSIINVSCHRFTSALSFHDHISLRIPGYYAGEKGLRSWCSPWICPFCPISIWKSAPRESFRAPERPMSREILIKNCPCVVSIIIKKCLSWE